MLALVLGAAPASTASAYNQDTHQVLVDYAWQIMLAVDAVGRNDPAAREVFQTLTVSNDFSQRLQKAVEGIHAMPAQLPAPKESRCFNLDWIKTNGSVSPNWQNDNNFSDMRLSLVRYPIGMDYETALDCGIWYGWGPGSAYAPIVNGDHTGTVLGYWAQHPDALTGDYRLGVKLTNVAGLSAVEEGLIAAGALPAATTWVSVKCAWKCVTSVLSFSPGDCADCCKHAIQDGMNAVHDAVSGLDSFVPVIGEIKSDMIVGMGHHINVPLGDTEYDDISGLLVVNAGPYGVAGTLELGTTAFANHLGVTVHYDYSDAPKSYDVQGAQDGLPNSRHRNAADWEFLPFTQIPMTPVDNLAWYGQTQYRLGPGKNTNFLGYVLHAIADASVPMHVVGAFGWGHRPYEDAVSTLHPSLLGGGRATEPARLNNILLPRAEAYYKIISDWRAANPSNRADVPVRALVTAVAQRTWSIARTDPTLFNDAASLAYFSTSGKDPGTIAYTLKSAVMQELLDEAVAASIAYLVATGEVLP
jgi:hypothetical protein